MRIRHGAKALDKIELQMTPMIDIVFQLNIFFLFTFKIILPEGDFSIRMPSAAAARAIEMSEALPMTLVMIFALLLMTFGSARDAALVFSGVGSKPPIGMPWAPSEITRMTSELSRAILMDSGRLRYQISWASGLSGVRGGSTCGIWTGEWARKLACRTSRSSRAFSPTTSWGTVLDWSM